MSIYPNPTDGEFAIKVATDNCTIEIYNIIGEVILKRSEAPLHSHINLTNKVNGLYIVKVMHEGILLGEQKIVKD